ncbi:MAG: helix-turn-helix transcriptional regulator [Candidatus Brocadiales bacterium]|nr:helix-turn-helix transcriptional regulator [Candidatus Bathyanammoxibius sp.]
MRKSPVGSRIRRARQNLGLTQATLAARLGKARVSVANYELGRVQVPGDVLAKIAKNLHVTSDYLLGLAKDGRTA